MEGYKMKRKILSFGVTALLALVLVLPGCDTGGDVGTNLIGGSVSSKNIKFSVKAPGSKSVRAAVGNTLTPISGQLQYGSVIINLEGFYDPASKNFTFAGAAGNNAFEFYGFADESGKAAGKMKVKDGAGEWTEEIVFFEFDSSILISGNAQTSAPGLPADWMGKWRPFQESIRDYNAQQAEQWDVEGEMILSPHSIAFWFDVMDRMEYVEYEVENAKPFSGTGWDTEAYCRQELMIEQVYNRQSAFSIFEIEKKTVSGNEVYDVLASKTTMVRVDDTPGTFKTESNYIKLRFQEGATGYEDELWITFCTFGDGEWDTKTDDITKARAGDNFDVDRDEWENYSNYTMLVAIR
jgi:hypothetical protein